MLILISYIFRYEQTARAVFIFSPTLTSNLSSLINHFINFMITSAIFAYKNIILTPYHSFFKVEKIKISHTPYHLILLPYFLLEKKIV